MLDEHIIILLYSIQYTMQKNSQHQKLQANTSKVTIKLNQRLSPALTMRVGAQLCSERNTLPIKVEDMEFEISLEATLKP